MTSKRFNRKPSELKKSLPSTESLQKIKSFLDYSYSDDEFIKDLIITNAVLERIAIRQMKKNVELEKLLEQKNDPSFYFNNN